MFDKVKANGSPRTCKFCGTEVWWHTTEGRYYDTDGVTDHYPTCKRARDHYSNEGSESAQRQRDRRGR